MTYNRTYIGSLTHIAFPDYADDLEVSEHSTSFPYPNERSSRLTDPSRLGLPTTELNIFPPDS